MFLSRMFQFRSSNRDQETDRRRIVLVEKAVRSAAAGAEAEVAGLRTRISKARTSLTCLLARIEDGDREARCRAELTKVERRLLAAEQRLAQMKEHLSRLRELERLTVELTTATRNEASRKEAA
jgi:hypothetical protein